MSAMAPAGMELSCTTGGCKFVTPAMELALALQYMKFHQEDHHTQKEQFVLKCSECQYTTPECQGLWTAN